MDRGGGVLGSRPTTHQDPATGYGEKVGEKFFFNNLIRLRDFSLFFPSRFTPHLHVLEPMGPIFFTPKVRFGEFDFLAPKEFYEVIER